MPQEQVRRQPRKQSRKQKTMVDKLINYPKSYLVESFTLSSEDRVVSRKGKGRIPDPSYRKQIDQLHQLPFIARQSGKKVRDIDLRTLTLHFENYVDVVNVLLERIYRNLKRAQELGGSLARYRGRTYTLLRKEADLNYQNKAFRERMYERLFRNALEQAGRMLLADYTRRELFNAALEFLDESRDDLLMLMRRKRIPSVLIRKVRDSCEAIKNNGSGYHYTMGVLRQLRLAIDRNILETMDIKIGWRARQRKVVSTFLKRGSSDLQKVANNIEFLVKDWLKHGYPFNTPKLRRYSLDFSASTENSTGQGYWFTLDQERDNEILLHLKLPPGIDGREHNDSPYRSKTLTLRFLDWLPRAVSQDEKKAERAERENDFQRSEQLRFRAAKFADMHQQLMNTIQLQHHRHKLSRLMQKKSADSEEIAELDMKVKKLKDSRRSAPPRILLRGQRVTLQIPFRGPNGVVSSQVLGEREYPAKAGVDRGIRAPVALSVEKEQSFEDVLITVEPLVEKREIVRRHAYKLTSELTRKKNNWDKKRSGQCYPASILKRDRHVEALWRKVRRLDHEITRLVASQTVWFCEEHRVKRLFFEDLRSYQAHAGSKDLSYKLSSNLWGRIIDTVRYMREQLGHNPYSVWTVNPRYTSQTCHVCGERGLRVEDETSTTEKKGGEYFYCSKCSEHCHADINAARNIIHVQDSSVVPGGINNPDLSK